MKKKIVLSAAIASLLGTVQANAADTLSTMFLDGKSSGQIRTFWVDREYQGTSGNDTHRDGMAIGGHLKFETADYEGLSFGSAFYTVNALAFISSPRDDYATAGTKTKNDMSLLGPNNENYSMIGEMYAQYKKGNTVFKAGRQKIDSPLAGTDDARMVPNLFEGYMLVNKDLPDTTIIAGHLTKFAQGTFGRIYDHSLYRGYKATSTSMILSATSGYSFVDSLDHTGSFTNMGFYAGGKKTDGVSVVSATYTGIKGLKAQLWDYYAHDILNAIYGEVNYSFATSSLVKPYLGAQLIKQNSVGDKLAGDIDSLYIATKVGAKIENLDLSVAYSQIGKNKASDLAGASTQDLSRGIGQKNAVITPWGGMPGYTQGMVTRHMFLAGTKASKIMGTYNFKDMGANVSAMGYYAEFKMDANSGYGIARTASESGFDVIYNTEFVKNLQLRVRGNFPRDFFEGAAGATGWSEYRFIANYNF
jgi:imipenem/basic amino acid-specific outer membrane pore